MLSTTQFTFMFSSIFHQYCEDCVLQSKAPKALYTQDLIKLRFKLCLRQRDPGQTLLLKQW